MKMIASQFAMAILSDYNTQKENLLHLFSILNSTHAEFKVLSLTY